MLFYYVGQNVSAIIESSSGPWRDEVFLVEMERSVFWTERYDSLNTDGCPEHTTPVFPSKEEDRR